MQKFTTWAVIFLAVAGVALAGISAANSREAVQIVTELKKEPIAMTLETEWKDAQGVNHKVQTNQLPGESIDECTGRHAAAVAALQKLFPPV